MQEIDETPSIIGESCSVREVRQAKRLIVHGVVITSLICIYIYINIYICMYVYINTYLFIASRRNTGD
jgi:hypothetical protein